MTNNFKTLDDARIAYLNDKRTPEEFLPLLRSIRWWIMKESPLKNNLRKSIENLQLYKGPISLERGFSPLRR